MQTPISDGRSSHFLIRFIRVIRGSFLHKNVTIFGLTRPRAAPHLVYPLRELRYYLLFTGIHRLLAPLFAAIDTLLT